MELSEAVREFLDILEEKEEKDSGRAFHPTTISSCRCMKMERISELITEMKKQINYMGM